MIRRETGKVEVEGKEECNKENMEDIKNMENMENIKNIEDIEYIKNLEDIEDIKKEECPMKDIEYPIYNTNTPQSNQLIPEHLISISERDKEKAKLKINQGKTRTILDLFLNKWKSNEEAIDESKELGDSHPGEEILVEDTQQIPLPSYTSNFSQILKCSEIIPIPPTIPQNISTPQLLGQNTNPHSDSEDDLQFIDPIQEKSNIYIYIYIVYRKRGANKESKIRSNK